LVEHIYSRVDPLGVLLASGMTGRKRYEDYGNLVLFQKGAAPFQNPRNRTAVADLLRENGIDPANILEDGLSAEGYRRRAHRYDPTAAYGPANPTIVWCDWPTPEFGRHVMNVYRGEI
jgi:hypothetical protein